jgi:hypothetical protein
MRMLRWLAIGAGLMVSTSALADSPQVYDLRLSAAMTQAITKMLMTAPMPWQESNPILQEVMKQVQAQQQAADKPADPAK